MGALDFVWKKKTGQSLFKSLTIQKHFPKLTVNENWSQTNKKHKN